MQVPGAKRLTPAARRSKTVMTASSSAASAATVQTHDVTHSQPHGSGDDTTVEISIEELRSLAEGALATLGYTAAETRTIAEVRRCAALNAAAPAPRRGGTPPCASASARHVTYTPVRPWQTTTATASANSERVR